MDDRKRLFLKTRIPYLFFAIWALLYLWPTHTLWAQEETMDDMEFTTLMSQVRSFRNQDRMVRALESLELATKHAEATENTQQIIRCDFMYAEIYLDLDRLSEAQFYYDRLNEQLETVEYFYGNAARLYLEGRIDSKTGNNHQALDRLNDAKTESNDRNLLNRITLSEGEFYTIIPNGTDRAVTRFNALRENSDPFEKDYLKARAFIALGDIYNEQGEVENAINNAESAMKLAQDNEFSKIFERSNRLLVDLYQKTGEYDKAIPAVMNLLNLRDSTYSVQRDSVRSMRLNELMNENLLEQVDKQRAEISELSESASRSEITVILTTSFLTIISLLAISLYRNNQIKLKTNDLLQTKNRELQLARDSAVQAMEAKTNFLSTVSHELRTPLYAVTGLTHLLIEEKPRKNQLEHLKSLKFSGDYLLNFINDILQINKIDAEKLEPLLIDCNLHKVLNEVINGLQQSAREKNNNLVLDYDSQIPSHLLSDPVKLSQIFMNLIGNAIKFTKDGEVEIIARLLRREGEYAHVYFEIRDTGIGIEAEQQETIFDSFEQGSIQINREYGGTGLGLTIVKSLLGLFESTIHLESEHGIGSTFYFELKMKCKDLLVEELPFAKASSDYRFDNLHLLIVEDNKINQVITRKMLSKKEITCDIASDGGQAIEFARANTYDGILMDIHMPGIGGVEATIEIRKFDTEIPIIALTAISLDDSLEEFYAAGCNDVVTKPFKPELFYDKIGENIVEAKLRRAAT
jgi:signal transduction histidine kinase/CheY-like chemotaxis protein